VAFSESVENNEEHDRIEWTAEERENFFAAVERHRRAAWRVTLASSGVNALVAFIVAALMAPLFYVVLSLILDIINLIVPMPNLVAVLGGQLGPAFDHPETVSVGRWVYLLVLAALPGLVWMGTFLLVLRRAIGLSGLFGGGDIQARAPNPAALAEQRFANVVGEMAIAANLPPPRVLISDHGGLNAAVFGMDEQHATIVASRGLLDTLNREQMQGIAGHLVGSIANGDMKIGVRVAITLGLFGLIARMAGVIMEGRAARQLGKRLLLGVVSPTAKNTRALLEEISDPFAPAEGETQAERAKRRAQNPKQNEWRTYLWMPLVGPLGMTGFFGALVNMFLLEPLVSLAWRRRKYMADATAVRLTRLPDALSGALEKMGSAAASLFGPYAAHLLVVRGPTRSSGLMGTSMVPPFPSIDRRLRALAKMGATIRSTPQKKIPPTILAIGIPLGALVLVLVGVCLYLLVFVSMALSMLFLGLPFSIVHLLLRWLGH
jgi:Zn-dependent protease with chaperone function